MNNVTEISNGTERGGAFAGLTLLVETFSESFSRGVRNCLFEQCKSYLHLLGKLRNSIPKTGHEPSKTDPRLLRRNWSEARLAGSFL